MPDQLVDWDHWGERLQRHFRDEPPAIALSYHFRIVVDLDEEYVQRDRRGFRTCSRECIRGKIVDIGNHEVTLEHVREVSAEIAETLSTEINAGLKSSMSAKLGASLGEVETGMEASLDVSRTSTRSVTISVRQAATTTQTLTLDHGPDCTRTRVPWGCVATLTLRGPLTILRYFTIGPRFAITWTDQFVFDFSQVEVDLSVDFDFFYDEVEATPLDCSGCDPAEGHKGDAKPKEREPLRTEPRKRFEERPSQSSIRDEPKQVAGVFTLLPTELGKPSKHELPPDLSLRRLEGVNTVLSGRLLEAGLGDLQRLAESDVESLVGVSAKRLGRWRSMAKLLLIHPQLDGNDAELLVRGLGIDSPERLHELRGTVTKAKLDEAIRATVLPTSYDVGKMIELLGIG